MKTLLLMRHAKSNRDEETLPDFERPLNARGERDAPRMGALLGRSGPIPDHVVTSAAVRARRTAELAAAQWRVPCGITVTPDLYHADVDVWTDVVGRFDAHWNTVLCVGHNPGLEELILILTGCEVPMPTAAVAHLTSEAADWETFVAARHIVVHDVWRPKELL